MLLHSRKAKFDSEWWVFQLNESTLLDQMCSDKKMRHSDLQLFFMKCSIPQLVLDIGKLDSPALEVLFVLLYMIRATSKNTDDVIRKRLLYSIDLNQQNDVKELKNICLCLARVLRKYTDIQNEFFPRISLLKYLYPVMSVEYTWIDFEVNMKQNYSLPKKMDAAFRTLIYDLHVYSNTPSIDQLPIDDIDLSTMLSTHKLSIDRFTRGDQENPGELIQSISQVFHQSLCQELQTLSSEYQALFLVLLSRFLPDQSHANQQNLSWFMLYVTQHQQLQNLFVDHTSASQSVFSILIGKHMQSTRAQEIIPWRSYLSKQDLALLGEFWQTNIVGLHSLWLVFDRLYVDESVSDQAKKWIEQWRKASEPIQEASLLAVYLSVYDRPSSISSFVLSHDWLNDSLFQDIKWSILEYIFVCPIKSLAITPQNYTSQNKYECLAMRHMKGQYDIIKREYDTLRIPQRSQNHGDLKGYFTDSDIIRLVRSQSTRIYIPSSLIKSTEYRDVCQEILTMPLKYQSVAFFCIVKMLIHSPNLSETWRTFLIPLYHEGDKKQHDIYVNQYMNNFVMIRDQMNQWVVKSFGVLPILCATDVLKQSLIDPGTLLTSKGKLEDLVKPQNDSVKNNRAVCLHMSSSRSREKVHLLFLQKSDFPGYPPNQFLHYALMDIDVDYFSSNTTLFTLKRMDGKSQPFDLSFLPTRIQQYVPVLSREISILSHLTHLLDHDRYLYDDYRAKQQYRVKENTLFVLMCEPNLMDSMMKYTQDISNDFITALCQWKKDVLFTTSIKNLDSPWREIFCQCVTELVSFEIQSVLTFGSEDQKNAIQLYAIYFESAVHNEIARNIAYTMLYKYKELTEDMQSLTETNKSSFIVLLCVHLYSMKDRFWATHQTAATNTANCEEIQTYLSNPEVTHLESCDSLPENQILAFAILKYMKLAIQDNTCINLTQEQKQVCWKMYNHCIRPLFMSPTLGSVLSQEFSSLTDLMVCEQLLLEDRVDEDCTDAYYIQVNRNKYLQFYQNQVSIIKNVNIASVGDSGIEWSSLLCTELRDFVVLGKGDINQIWSILKQIQQLPFAEDLTGMSDHHQVLLVCWIYRIARLDFFQSVDDDSIWNGWKSVMYDDRFDEGVNDKPYAIIRQEEMVNLAVPKSIELYFNNFESAKAQFHTHGPRTSIWALVIASIVTTSYRSSQTTVPDLLTKYFQQAYSVKSLNLLIDEVYNEIKWQPFIRDILQSKSGVQDYLFFLASQYPTMLSDTVIRDKITLGFPPAWYVLPVSFYHTRFYMAPNKTNLPLSVSVTYRQMKPFLKPVDIVYDLLKSQSTMMYTKKALMSAHIECIHALFDKSKTYYYPDPCLLLQHQELNLAFRYAIDSNREMSKNRVSTILNYNSSLGNIVKLWKRYEVLSMQADNVHVNILRQPDMALDLYNHINLLYDRVNTTTPKATPSSIALQDKLKELTNGMNSLRDMLLMYDRQGFYLFCNDALFTGTFSLTTYFSVIHSRLGRYDLHCPALTSLRLYGNHQKFRIALALQYMQYDSIFSRKNYYNDIKFLVPDLQTPPWSLINSWTHKATLFQELLNLITVEEYVEIMESGYTYHGPVARIICTTDHCKIRDMISSSGTKKIPTMSPLEDIELQWIKMQGEESLKCAYRLLYHVAQTTLAWEKQLRKKAADEITTGNFDDFIAHVPFQWKSNHSLPGLTDIKRQKDIHESVEFQELYDILQYFRQSRGDYTRGQTKLKEICMRLREIHGNAVSMPNEISDVTLKRFLKVLWFRYRSDLLNNSRLYDFEKLRQVF